MTGAHAQISGEATLHRDNDSASGTPYAGALRRRPGTRAMRAVIGDSWR